MKKLTKREVKIITDDAEKELIDGIYHCILNAKETIEEIGYKTDLKMVVSVALENTFGYLDLDVSPFMPVDMNTKGVEEGSPHNILQNLIVALSDTREIYFDTLYATGIIKDVGDNVESHKHYCYGCAISGILNSLMEN